MNETQVLVERFEASRAHLQAVAYRMLGSLHEADDAVQEAWLRLNRSDVSGVDNLRGWLTTVVARVCLDMLRSRKSRREEPLAAQEPEPSATHAEGLDPEQEAVLADSVGLALLVAVLWGLAFVATRIGLAGARASMTATPLSGDVGQKRELPVAQSPKPQCPTYA